MIVSDKKVSELRKNLKNDDILFVTATIDLLRDSEPFEGAVAILANHYDNCVNITVKQSIALFLNDIKDTGVRKEIIETINLPLNEETISMLITSCWQSGLDYSEMSEEFIRIFKASGYDTAFECLTVIEQCMENIPVKEKRAIVSDLRSCLTSQPSEKRALVNELIRILEE
jgi:hypothetical protein